MFTTLAAAVAEVKPADPATVPTVAADRDRVEAEYREYLTWLEANADQLADDAREYDSYESGCYAW